MESAPQPIRVTKNQAKKGYAGSGVPVVRYITKRDHNSEVLLGTCEMKPGQETKFWDSRFNAKPDETPADTATSSEPKVFGYGPWHEVYYMLNGKLAVYYAKSPEEKPKRVELNKGDAFYFPPGFLYMIKNTGKTKSMFLYAGSPPPV
jgi:quercetin dioxygenase-like cupin family protein